MTFKLLILICCSFVLHSFAFGQLNVEPDIAGKWAVNKTLEGDETQFEGVLDICADGKAIYVVHSNQYVLYLTVKQQKIKGTSFLTLFYVDYADSGRGYFKFRATPKKGTLLMKATLGAEYQLNMQNMQPQFVKQLRAITDAKDTSIFPKHFYKDTFAEQPNCN